MDRQGITRSFVTDLYVVEHENGLHHVRSDPRGLALAARELDKMGVEAKIHMELKEEGDESHFEVVDLSFVAEGFVRRLILRGLTDVVPNTIFYDLVEWNHETGPKFSTYRHSPVVPRMEHTRNIRITTYTDYGSTWVFGHPKLLRILIDGCAKENVKCSYSKVNGEPSALHFKTADYGKVWELTKRESIPVWYTTFTLD